MTLLESELTHFGFPYLESIEFVVVSFQKLKIVGFDVPESVSSSFVRLHVVSCCSIAFAF